MTRMWVVLGDATTSGGQVISGSPFTDVDGHILSEASIVSVPWGAGRPRWEVCTE